MTENKTKHQKKTKYSENIDFNLTQQFVKMEKDTTLFCYWFEVRNNQKIDKNKICRSFCWVIWSTFCPIIFWLHKKKSEPDDPQPDDFLKADSLQISLFVEENTDNGRNPTSSNYYSNYCSNTSSNSNTISKRIVTVIVTNRIVTVSNTVTVNKKTLLLNIKGPLKKKSFGFQFQILTTHQSKWVDKHLRIRTSCATFAVCILSSTFAKTVSSKFK